MGGTVTMNLGAGCAGTYQNDTTIGYGGPINGCSDSSTVPVDPPADPDLRANGSPLANNYCGASAPLSVAPVNPAFSIDKTVQGDRDAGVVPPGGIGTVSPSGGSATYGITFT
ncbi:hypothetical protein SB719_19155, partial [Pantoea sp. SIMBA_079]